jgi:hypothetical protein
MIIVINNTNEEQRCESDHCLGEDFHVKHFLTRLLYINPRKVNELAEQCKLLANDQYAKAHLDEVQRLSDRIESVLIRWDEIIKELTDRIIKLEKTKRRFWFF